MKITKNQQEDIDLIRGRALSIVETLEEIQNVKGLDLSDLFLGIQMDAESILKAAEGLSEDFYIEED